MSPASKAQQKAVAKYETENYDKCLLRMPKGKKEKIREHIIGTKESINKFINRAIDETIERDKKDTD